MVPEIQSERDIIFCHFDRFLPFYPSNNPENQTFEKMKKASKDVIILHMCTKNHNHMIYVSQYMEHNRHVLSFWVMFCLFTPLTT